MAHLAPWAVMALVGAGTAAASTAVSLATRPKPMAPPPIPTRNQAADLAAQDDLMRRRRGAGANELIGPSGAEASTAGGKVLLGQ